MAGDVGRRGRRWARRWEYVQDQRRILKDDAAAAAAAAEEADDDDDLLVDAASWMVSFWAPLRRAEVVRSCG